MQKMYISLVAIASLSLQLQSAFTSSRMEGDEIHDITNSAFAKKPGRCGIFSYATDKGVSSSGGEALFSSDDFNQWKRACAKAAEKWIFGGKKITQKEDNRTEKFSQETEEDGKIVYKKETEYTKTSPKNIKEEEREYEYCRNLTSELTLALKLIHDKKYALTNNMAAIRSTLDPVVQAAKRVKGSLFKRFKGTFKSETAERNVINTIKDILNKRVEELFNDFNETLKMSGKKDVKKISF
jgi:hypothetical protein